MSRRRAGDPMGAQIRRRHVQENGAQVSQGLLHRSRRRVHEQPRRKKHNTAISHDDERLGKQHATGNGTDIIRSGEGGDWRWLCRRHQKLSRSVGVLNSDEQSGPDLPFHLIVQNILVRLPLRQLRQLCSVCKPWNATLTWGGAAAPVEFPQHEEEEYWFVMRSNHPSAFTACSTHDSVPFSLPLLSDQLLSYLGGVHCPRLATAFYDPSHELIASAGGLLSAIVHNDSGGYSVLVFNCLTGSLKVLPQLPPWGREELFYFDACLMYMAIDNDDPCRYYIMLCNVPPDIRAHQELPYFAVFDSKTGRWKAGSRVITKSSGRKVPLGDFFLRQGGPCTSKVLAYNVDLDFWSAVQVPACGPHSPYPHKYRGRLFGACFLEEDKAGRSFGVWELQVSSSETATWVEVSRTPEKVAQSMPRPTRWRLQEEGGLFYTRWHNEQGPLAPLVYDVSRNLWYVQSLPLERGNDLVFVHRPRLSMFLA